MFWIVAAAMCLLVGTIVLRPLMMRDDAPAPAQNDIALYRAQLNELDNDIARGTIEPAEAERAKTEISRRILSADKIGVAALSVAPKNASRALAYGLGGLLLAWGAGVYLIEGAPGALDYPRKGRIADAAAFADARPSQAQMEIEALAPLPSNAPAQYVTLVTDLRAAMIERPDDLQGWELLSLHEARLGDFVAARLAQEQVLRLKGNAATPQDSLAWLDRAVAATGGRVSPEAQAIAEAIRREIPDWAPPDYYLGLHFAQTGRPDLAFNLWRRVLTNGEADSAYVGFARQQIEDAAYLAGVEYELPELDLRGPDAAAIAAATDMTEQDRGDMIQNMVANLSERLANEGGSAQEWAQLISALGVLGDIERATAIHAEAQQVFAEHPDDLGMINSAARSAGISQ